MASALPPLAPFLPGALSPPLPSFFPPSALLSSAGTHPSAPPTQQVAKLLVIPFVCFVEAVWYGRRFNTATLTAIGVVIIGVATV